MDVPKGFDPILVLDLVGVVVLEAVVGLAGWDCPGCADRYAASDVPRLALPGGGRGGPLLRRAQFRPC
jgi:hypothetical protein